MKALLYCSGEGRGGSAMRHTGMEGESSARIINGMEKKTNIPGKVKNQHGHWV